MHGCYFAVRESDERTKCSPGSLTQTFVRSYTVFVVVEEKFTEYEN